MTAPQKKAFLQERLDCSYLWRLFAAKRNGIPTQPERNIIQDETDVPHATKTTTSSSSTTSSQSKLGPAIALTLAMLLGGGAAGYAALKYFAQPAANPAAVTAQAPAKPSPKIIDGDLLNELHKKGYNLPPR